MSLTSFLPSFSILAARLAGHADVFCRLSLRPSGMSQRVRVCGGYVRASGVSCRPGPHLHAEYCASPSYPTRLHGIRPLQVQLFYEGGLRALEKLFVASGPHFLYPARPAMPVLRRSSPCGGVAMRAPDMAFEILGQTERCRRSDSHGEAVLVLPTRRR